MKYTFIFITLFLLLLTPNPVEAKRMAPERVAPVKVGSVEQNGIRYAVPHFSGSSEGMEHNGGYVEAIDIKTNKRLWLKEVYKPKYNPFLESDIQDVFITSLTIENNTLIIINEANEKFSLDLADNGASIRNNLGSAPSANHIVTNVEEINKQKYIYIIFLSFIGVVILMAAFYLFLVKRKR